MESSEPEFTYRKSGFLIIIFLCTISLLMIFAGYYMDIAALSIWGFVFLIGCIFALLPIFSRIFALKRYVSTLREMEQRRVLEEKIKEILRKHELGEAEEESSE